MPCFTATPATEAPASSVSSTTRLRSAAPRRRRTPAPDPTLTSTSAIQTSSRHQTTMYTRPRQDAYVADVCNPVPHVAVAVFRMCPAPLIELALHAEEPGFISLIIQVHGWFL